MKRFVRGIDMGALRLKARHLIFNKGLTQKEAAKVLGVSQKTFSKWSKAYNWQQQLSSQSDAQLTDSYFIKGFMEFVKAEDAELYKSVQKCLDKYINGVAEMFNRE